MTLAREGWRPQCCSDPRWLAPRLIGPGARQLATSSRLPAEALLAANERVCDAIMAARSLVAALRQRAAAEGGTLSLFDRHRPPDLSAVDGVLDRLCDQQQQTVEQIALAVKIKAVGESGFVDATRRDLENGPQAITAALRKVAGL